MSMNEEIETLFAGFKVNDQDIPVEFMFYEGHGEPYVTYRQYDNDASYSADDELQGYVTFYDFDVYGTGNIQPIINSVKALLKGAGWTWQPGRDGPDMFDKDTEYFHKTVCFAKETQIKEIT